MRATCGKPKPSETNIKAVQVLKIKDFVYYHNMSITYNGDHYFTINGGNENYCKLNEYDEKGKAVSSYDVGLDGRAIFYNSDLDQMYVKVYGQDLYSIGLENNDANIEYSYIFEDDNSSSAMSPDGLYFYEFVRGKVRVINSEDGTIEDSFYLPRYTELEEDGHDVSIAASDNNLFVWGSIDEVFIYDLSGSYIDKVKLPRIGYGFSLSYCNGLLWIAQDANARDKGTSGYWFGYRLDSLE
jgi:hypothetical protein